ncbi:PH domain-containing protein [Pseudonocardia sp. TRM90224]|uniref:PH domain-containing protein n=1 Tax=Pseudonocardia sp. TRM90224 TaxID=2812678 RepID=UPI001E2EFB50|nr:PH domain-containing protein [Pseudonocardia sp. TRM90224]
MQSLLTEPAGGRGGTILAFVGVLAFTGTWMTLVWRVGHVGLEVSSIGLRARTVFRTRTIPWAAVADIESAVTAYRSGRQGIWIVLKSWDAVATPLVLANEKWVLPRSIDPGERYLQFLPPDAYAGALAELKDLHRRHLT